MAGAMNRNKGSYGKRKCKCQGDLGQPGNQARHWLVTLEPGLKAAGTGALRVGNWSRGSSLTVLEELRGS